jgi:hypothetical protein
MMRGTIRLVVGFLLMFGAVGGMDDPANADYLVHQIIAALTGAALAFWAIRDINRNADSTIRNLKG